MITTAHPALAQRTPVSFALCCALSPPAVPQPGQKLHLQPSTNQLCLRGALLPKLVLLLYYFQRGVSSWDSLSVSVISTHSDYLRNEDEQISLIFSLHLYDFLFFQWVLGAFRSSIIHILGRQLALLNVRKMKLKNPNKPTSTLKPSHRPFVIFSDLET